MSGSNFWKPLFPAIWGAAAFALLGLWIGEPPSTAISARFVAPEAASGPDEAQAPLLESFVVAAYADGKTHSPTVAVYDTGEVQVIWFRGTREADRSIRLETSRLVEGVWTPPEGVLSGPSETASRSIYVHTIGNPVLYRHPSGETWLFYVTPKIGGWSTSQVSLRRSADDGRTWEDAQTLRLSPFFNMSNLVRYQPVEMEGGLIGLPAYLEFTRAYSEIAVVDATGAVVDKRRIGEGIQADLVVDSTRATALLRPLPGMQSRTYISESSDGGLTWTPPAPTGWTNPSAPVCVARFADGGAVAAFNDDERMRSSFAFAYRPAGSDGWQPLAFRIESVSVNDGITYCDMDLGPDQSVTMVYSRASDHSISGLRFNKAWVEAETGAGAGAGAQ